MLVACESEPEEPATVTVYWPAFGVPLTEMAKVEVAVPPEGTDTVPGLNVSVKPEIGLADSTTLPENVF
jgi:hypothetical protein